MREINICGVTLNPQPRVKEKRRMQNRLDQAKRLVETCSAALEHAQQGDDFDKIEQALDELKTAEEFVHLIINEVVCKGLGERCATTLTSVYWHSDDHLRKEV